MQLISYSSRSSFGESSFKLANLKEQSICLSARVESSWYFWHNRNRMNSFGFKSLRAGLSGTSIGFKLKIKSMQSARKSKMMSLI